MNTLFTALGSSIAIEYLGWSLIHFIWQATVIATIVRLLLSVIPARHSVGRYWCCCVGLLAMAACPIFTCCYLQTSAVPKLSTGTKHARLAAADLAPVVDGVVIRKSDAASTKDPTQLKNQNSAAPEHLASARLKNWLPVMVLIWSVGVFWQCLRLAMGVVRVHNLSLIHI